jgi:hypothetical protein
VSVETAYGTIDIKVARAADGLIKSAMPEYEQCRTASQVAGVPLRVVEAAAQNAFNAANAKRRVKIKRRNRGRMSRGISNIEALELPTENAPTHKEVDLARIAQGVRLILEGIGEDPDRPGLRRTPERVAEMYAELTAGMREDPAEYVVALPGDSHDQMVIVKDIQIASICEHHLAPFVGKCHIAYIPKKGASSDCRNSRASPKPSRGVCRYRNA